MEMFKRVDFKKEAIILKALGDAKRLQILNLIVEGTQCNCDFCDILNLQPNLVSHHLRILKNAGLVEIKKDPIDSRWIYYSINSQTFDVLQKFFTEFFNLSRIRPRQATCGPQSGLSIINELSSQTQ